MALEEDLTKWIFSVDRRVLVMRAIDANGAFSAAEIAERSGRSVQNISRAIHELEERGLIECINPDKRTWKRFLLTDRGRSALKDLRKSSLVD